MDRTRDDGSEFGLAPGMLDAEERAQRTLSAEDQLREIYALPKSFGGSMPDRKEPEETPVPRLLPGEKEDDRK